MRCPHCSKEVLLVKDDGKHGNATPPAERSPNAKLEAGELDALLDACRTAETTPWEDQFLIDFNVKFDKYGDKMFVTEKQLKTLRKIADGEPPL